MKLIFKLIFVITFIFGGIFCSAGQSDNEVQKDSSKKTGKKSQPAIPKKSKFETLITFIELGSVKCIPCQMMQPIMKSVATKYANQIKVIFYDVWKPEERHYAQIYQIRVIPTQVFLNSKGEEILRHEGFFPEEELDKFLKAAGLVIQPQ